MTEHQTVEYKQVWKDEYLKWICGFANAGGGVLVVGRNDDGEAVGVAHAGKLLEDIPNKVRNILGIMVEVQLREEDGKALLEIGVEAYLSPVNYKGEYYFRSSIPIQISVYPDKLMIWNPGELPPNWTVEKLLDKHASQPFNPDVANVFFRAGMIESWGRGIERIMQACAEAGMPTPEVSCDVNGLWMSFRFLPEHRAGGGHEGGGTTQETTQETIIKWIKSNPAITQKGLSDKTGLTVDGVKYHLKKLKDTGMIKRSGSTKAGRWEVLK